MPKEKIKFFKIRDVESPNRAHADDAGIDFFVPNFSKEFVHDLLDKDVNAQAFEIPVEKEDTKYEQLNNFTGISYVTVSDPATVPISTPQQLFGFDIEVGLPYFILRPQKRVNIPSGIKCEMSNKGLTGGSVRALIVANKSGIAAKQGLVFGAQVVDYSYTGEIHLNVINTSDEDVRIYAGQKLVQMLETPIFTSEVEIVGSLTRETERGEGGFGSTDKKS